MLNRLKIKYLFLNFMPRMIVKRINSIYSSYDVCVYNIEDVRKKEYQYSSFYPTFKVKYNRSYKKYEDSLLLDVSGIPRIKIKGRYYYHPIRIIQYGLAEYNIYLSGNRGHIENVFKVADWLVDNQIMKGAGYGGWDYTFDYFHNPTGTWLASPWQSAMAQGQAVSLLCRAYTVKVDERYLTAAINAIKRFEIPVSEGGFMRDLWGHFFLEEYPTSVPSYTLNGFIYCMFGLYDLYCACGENKAKELFDRCMLTLRFILPMYDGEFYSQYCLSHIVSANKALSLNYGYHILHIDLLQHINYIKQDEVFEYYIKRWAQMSGHRIS